LIQFRRREIYSIFWKRLAVSKKLLYWLQMFVFFCGCFPAIFVFLSMFGKVALICELSSHFFIQYFFALTLAVLFYLITRKWRLALGFGVFWITAAIELAPFYIPQPQSVPPNAPQLSIVQSNVNTKNQEYDRVADYVLKTNADVAAFEETSQAWVDHLKKRLSATYPYEIDKPREDNFGIALFSKYPFTKASIEEFGKIQLPSTLAQIEVQGKPVTLIGTHALPPMDDEMLNTRTLEMKGYIERRKDFGERFVLFGDLNCSSWSPYFGDLLTGLGVRDSRLGFGVQPSWPDVIPLLWTPIDHLLVNDAFVVIDRKIGPHVGSDHFPVFAKLAIVR
jgi:endonuclease/exonuclease/phosphatase (EEP) superfamily protein YafD